MSGSRPDQKCGLPNSWDRNVRVFIFLRVALLKRKAEHHAPLLGFLQGFGRGSTMMYQLSTAHDLGHLEYIRIWHDSSGRGSWQDWFLSEIGVEDLQTRER